MNRRASRAASRARTASSPRRQRRWATYAIYGVTLLVALSMAIPSCAQLFGR